jgi:uncharacterized protein (TIGR03382 family)
MGALRLFGGRFAGACLAAAAATGAAQGAAFNIDDRDPNEGPIIVSANDFEFGLSINGAPFQVGLNNFQIAPFAGESLSFDGQFIDNGDTAPLSRTVYFIEPGTLNQVSDIFTYNFQPTGDGFSVRLFGTFVSDSDPGSLGTIPIGTSPLDIWPEGVDFTYGTTGFGGVVQTDLPAPATGVLAVFGAAAIGRRRRKA